MIYITGDMHGDQRRITNYILNKNWTHDDILIVCGDFGYIFYNDHSEHLFLNDIEEKCPFTIAFLAGNHENFNAIKKYPQEEWCGNLIHRIRKNIVFLINGNIYNINNRSFFVFGGGTSRDKEFRELNATWFEEEMPSDEDYLNANKNLKNANFDVDFILTHTAPSFIAHFDMERKPHKNEYPLNNFLNKLYFKSTFIHWYFGHFHEDRDINTKMTCVWFDVIELT